VPPSRAEPVRIAVIMMEEPLDTVDPTDRESPSANPHSGHSFSCGFGSGRAGVWRGLAVLPGADPVLNS
jgi:hypothetical protein